MGDNKRKPDIRFQGFTDDWEQRKLGECFTERKDSMPEGELISVTIGEGIKKFSELGRHDNSNDDKSKYKKVCVGDIAYNSMRMWQGASGYSPYEGIVSPAYTVLSPITDVVDSKCISYLFKRSDMTHVFQMNSQGITSDNWNLKYPALSEIEIMVSPYLAEQHKIAAYLSRIDNLITLQQRKCDKLVNVKKSMLEKMFAREGAKVPEIRFEGFTDDWEQRKLEDYIIEYHEVTTENNQYPALTSSRKGIFLQTEYFAGNQIASDDNTGYNIVPYGYFTYRHMSDDEIFHFNINDIVENGIVSTLYPVFTTNDKLDSRYLQYQLNYGYEFARFAVLQKQGGSRTYMYLSKLKQLSLTMPKDVEEQKKISGFLMELDNLITLQQREHSE